MRIRPLAVATGALLAIGMAASPAQAAPETAPTVAAGAVTSQEPTAGAPRAGGPVRPLADPGPECTGQGHGCWEYYSWYWTYSSCHDEGRAQLQNNPGRYDNYNCAGDHGLVVWLWLHRP